MRVLPSWNRMTGNRLEARPGTHQLLACSGSWRLSISTESVADMAERKVWSVDPNGKHPSVEVVTVTTNPILACGLEQLIEAGPNAWCCRRLTGADLARAGALSGCDVVLVAPQHWEEMASWLPALQRRLA